MTKIYLAVSRVYGGGDVIGHAIADTGECIASHMSSNRNWLRHDLYDNRKAIYDERYGLGQYEIVDLIDAERPLEHPEFAAAFELNQEMGRAAEAARQHEVASKPLPWPPEDAPTIQ